MSAAEAARLGTGLAFVVMPLVFVFAFATHPDLLRPRVLRPEQLIDRARGSRLLHAGHGLVTINTALMIVVALHLGGIVTRHGAGRAGLLGTLLAVLGTVLLAADKGALCLTMSALDGLGDDEFAAARPALSAIFAKKGWLWLLWGILLFPSDSLCWPSRPSPPAQPPPGWPFPCLAGCCSSDSLTAPRS